MQTPQGIQPPSQDLFYDNPEEWRRQQEAYQQYQINNSIQQASIPLLQSQAEMAKRASKEGENALIWQRWGPEIEALCAQMPLQLKANPQTWEEAVSIVRGRHYKELAQAEAERLAAGNGHAPMTERGSSTPDAPRGSDMRPLDKMFADNHPYAKRFKDAGLSAADIRARLPKMGYTGPDAEKNYVEAVTNSHIVLSGRESIAQAGAY